MRAIFLVAALQKAGKLQRGTQEVRTRQQEGARPVRQLLGPEREADQTQGRAGSSLPGTSRPCTSDLPIAFTCRGACVNDICRDIIIDFPENGGRLHMTVVSATILSAEYINP